MSIYEKPVWKLMYDMVEDLGLRKGEVFSKDQVLAWFAEHYPKIKGNTISAHLIRQSTNAPSRIHYHGKPGDDDLFFRINGSHFRLYDPETDPPPIYGRAKQAEKSASVPHGESSLADDVLRVIQEHERDWQQRLQDSEKRGRALEQENERLRKKLDKGTSTLGEITDKVLKERLSRLGSPPLDTVIREAGVVLEDRLRTVGGADSTLHGVGLVDAVLGSERPTLVFSSHPGEQDGVRMLYRGAMQFIRNPPMHKYIEYSESTARLLIRLIDSLLQLLSEGEPPGLVTVDDIQRMLTRRPIPNGQKAFYRALYDAGDRGLSGSELAAIMKRSRYQVAGVLGALGHRINGTEGLEDKGGVKVIVSISQLDDGDQLYQMRPVLREALEAENIVRSNELG
jgi:hypothetical protein